MQFPEGLDSLEITGRDEEDFHALGIWIKRWSLATENRKTKNKKSDATEEEEKFRLFWLGQKERVLQDAIALHEAGRSLTAFLMATSVVDRALGDVAALLHFFSFFFFVQVFLRLTDPSFVFLVLV